MKTIVIGAGAAGLMAAYGLSRKGVEVSVLEASSRIGGRVHTFVPDGFAHSVEAGAEFIHGDLKLTKSLMKKAGLGRAEASMDMSALENGKIGPAYNSKYWVDFEKYASKLKKDCTVSEFLDTYFPEPEHRNFRGECEQMAQGLDLADPKKLSMFCIREEWTSSETQFRPVSGYGPLLEFLAAEISSKHGVIQLNQTVRQIDWSGKGVSVTTDSAVFEADNAIVAVTLGNLQHNAIAFFPEIDSRIFHEIGFGEVIKIALEFEFPFWEGTHPGLGFLFTDDGFTFWTQLSFHRPLLTGWIGNDRAEEFEGLSDAELTELLVAKLELAFPDSDVSRLLRSSAVFRYTKNQLTNGAYSWAMPQSRKAIAKINSGIGNKIWFAGEAFERTADVGTVEAALRSGRYVGRKVLGSQKSDVKS